MPPIDKLDVLEALFNYDVLKQLSLPNIHLFAEKLLDEYTDESLKKLLSGQLDNDIILKSLADFYKWHPDYQQREVEENEESKKSRKRDKSHYAKSNEDNENPDSKNHVDSEKK